MRGELWAGRMWAAAQVHENRETEHGPMGYFTSSIEQTKRIPVRSGLLYRHTSARTLKNVSMSCRHHKAVESVRSRSPPPPLEHSWETYFLLFLRHNFDQFKLEQSQALNNPPRSVNYCHHASCTGLRFLESYQGNITEPRIQG